MARFLSTFLAISMAVALPLAMPVWADHHNHGGDKQGEPGVMKFHFHKVERFKKLKEELKLNPQQTAAYDKLIKRYEEQGQKNKLRIEEWKKQDHKSMNAVQLMEQRVTHLNEHAKDATQDLEEFKSFYSTLTPEQQKKVDEFGRHIHHPRSGPRPERRQKVGPVGHVPAGEKPAPAPQSAPAPTPPAPPAP